MFLKLILATMFLLYLPQAQALGLCVKSTKAFLRAGPGTSHKVTWTVGRYMPFLRVDTKGNWSKVKDVDNQVHWIYTGILTQGFKCLVIKARKANLRTQPGGRFPRANYRAADKYEAFKRLDKKHGWYHVVNDVGEKGWVHESLVWVPKRSLTFNY